MYQLLTMIIMMFAFVSLYLKKSDELKLLRFEVFLMMIMICLRYGQGTDYFGYYTHYLAAPQNVIDFRYIFYSSIHGEVGWKFILNVCRVVGLSYEHFIAMIGMVSMICLYKSVRKFSDSYCLSIMLFYPTFYLTYYMSAMRQGFVIAIFIGVMLPLLLEKKYMLYSIIGLLISAIHNLGLILLIIPFIQKIKVRKLIKLWPIAMFGIVLTGSSTIQTFVNNTFQRKIFQVGLRFSFLAFAVRLILFIIILRLYKSQEEIDQQTDLFMKIYCVSFLVYIFVFPQALLSQRITAPFKVLEIFLIPNMLYQRYLHRISLKRSVPITLLLVLLINSVETYKNFNSYISQGNYYSNVNVINYPYISIFNKDKIYEYIYKFDDLVE